MVDDGRYRKIRNGGGRTIGGVSAWCQCRWQCTSPLIVTFDLRIASESRINILVIML